MQATLRFPLHEPSRDATAWTRPLGRRSLENRSSARAPDSVFQLTVWCAPSQEDIEPRLREALADNLIALKQRVTTTVSGKAFCKFEAIVRSGRVSRCQ
jgi:hypothetical protein